MGDHLYSNNREMSDENFPCGKISMGFLVPNYLTFEAHTNMVEKLTFWQQPYSLKRK